jgi:hypothetical protein
LDQQQNQGGKVEGVIVIHGGWWRFTGNASTWVGGDEMKKSSACRLLSVVCFAAILVGTSKATDAERVVAVVGALASGVLAMLTAFYQHQEVVKDHPYVDGFIAADAWFNRHRRRDRLASILSDTWNFTLNILGYGDIQAPSPLKVYFNGEEQRWVTRAIVRRNGFERLGAIERMVTIDGEIVTNGSGVMTRWHIGRVRVVAEGQRK